MITLYHGSNMAFSVPDLSVGRQGMDFGKGFYLTPNSGTAQKMAERVTRIRGFGAPIVLVFTFDDMAARQANMVLDFNVMDQNFAVVAHVQVAGAEIVFAHAAHPLSPSPNSRAAFFWAGVVGRKRFRTACFSSSGVNASVTSPGR